MLEIASLSLGSMGRATRMLCAVWCTARDILSVAGVMPGLRLAAALMLLCVVLA